MRECRGLRAVLPLVLVLAVALSGCFAPPKAAPVASAPAGPAPVYVALGAAETVGVGSQRPLVDAWPQLFFRKLPVNATFVNFAITGDTVDQAITDELPDAEAQHPTLATVWLNVDDVLAARARGRLRDLAATAGP
jgi:acyl-CoA thioesterase-1